MSKVWLVARFEFWTIVRRRSFVLATIGFPLLIAAVIGFGILTAIRSEDRRPLGYVDLAGIITLTPAQAASEPEVPLLALADEAAARAALLDQTIQGYVVLPDGYLQGEPPTLVGLAKAPTGTARSDFDAFLRANLLVGQSAEVRQSLSQRADLTVRSADGRREFSEAGIANVLLPFVAGFFFIYVVLSFSGYLLQAVTTEKENRTVEIMATSLAPTQLIGGKAAGLLAVALTQLAVWLGAATAALLIGSLFVPELAAIEVSWSLVALILLYFIPSFALMGGLMIAIGSAVSDLQQGQQIAGILNLFFMAPFFVLIILFAHPDGPLAIAMTLFPPTAFLTTTIRWGLTAIPLWQLALSWFMLVASALLTVWLAARVFRLGMLSYGQRLEWTSIRAALAGNR
jgi:ABC-2 type transport system permease protein